MTDWVSWHEGYDDLESSLARRLVAVQQAIISALDAVAAGPVQVLSLCSGDGRDLLGAMDGHPRRSDVRAVLVEQEGRLAAAARQRGIDEALSDQVTVRHGDAGDLAVFADTVPVDLLLLCGIFGNISDADIATVVGLTPYLVKPGGFVIWTRGWFEPDLREQIRTWFHERGCDEVSYQAEPHGYGVGVAHLRNDAVPAVAEPDGRLFTFTR